MFACAAHAGLLPLLGARPLLDRDRAVLARWEREHARWSLPAGHPDRPGPGGRPYEAPAPLAVGDDAVALLARLATAGR